MKTRLLLAALAATAAAATVGVGGATATQGHQTKYDTVTQDCVNSVTGQDEGDITYSGPVVVWPPNHKYVSATITLTDDDAEPVTDDASVAVTGTHDQILEDGSEMTGTGKTDPATDVMPGPPGAGNPTATTSVQFRAERSGRKWTDGDAWRGRTYTFTVTGTTDDGLTTCDPVEFTAVVPHDQGKRGGPATTGAKKVSARRLAARRARQ